LSPTEEFFTLYTTKITLSTLIFVVERMVEALKDEKIGDEESAQD
jgi:hypothetical protein